MIGQYKDAIPKSRSENYFPAQMALHKKGQGEKREAGL